MSIESWSTKAIRKGFLRGIRVVRDSGLYVPSRPEKVFDRWLAAHDAEVEAQALRKFADFIATPTSSGLDRYTLDQVAMEARCRADRIEREG